MEWLPGNYTCGNDILCFCLFKPSSCESSGKGVVHLQSLWNFCNMAESTAGWTSKGLDVWLNNCKPWKVQTLIWTFYSLTSASLFVTQPYHSPPFICPSEWNPPYLAKSPKPFLFTSQFLFSSKWLHEKHLQPLTLVMLDDVVGEVCGTLSSWKLCT